MNTTREQIQSHVFDGKCSLCFKLYFMCLLCHVCYLVLALVLSPLFCIWYPQVLAYPMPIDCFLFLLIFRDNVYLLVICSLALLFSFLSVPGEKIMFLYCTNQMNQFSLLFIAYSSHQSYCSKAGLGWCI